MNVFLITTVDGKTFPATNVRTFEDKGRQMLAMIYKGGVQTIDGASVAGISFGPPPAEPPKSPAAQST